MSFALLLAVASVPPTPAATEHVVNLATLTPESAVDGQRGLRVVQLDADTAPDDEGGNPILRDCVPSTPAVCRTVLLAAGNHAGGVLVVEGVLRVTCHPATKGPGGVEVPGMVQLRVVVERVR
jgi:hypothetical protein